jgi:hypothetical protein
VHFTTLHLVLQPILFNEIENRFYISIEDSATYWLRQLILTGSKPPIVTTVDSWFGIYEGERTDCLDLGQNSISFL